jgi:hypothetical protein
MMNTTAWAELQAGQRLELVLQNMAERIRVVYPSVTCAIHHGQNEDFPWWVVARFVYPGAESHSVDVSVECQRRDGVLQLRADIARENGYVLSEFSAVERTRTQDGQATGAWFEERLKQIEEFLLQQIPTIRGELT